MMTCGAQESVRNVTATSVFGSCKPNVLMAVIGQQEPLPQNLQVMFRDDQPGFATPRLLHRCQALLRHKWGSGQAVCV